MNLRMKRVYQLCILCGIGVLLMILALATPLAVTGADFSIYNPGWNGCSDLAVKTYETGRFQPRFYVDENELTLVQKSFTESQVEAENATLLVIGPKLVFSEEEAEYVHSFLSAGGVVLVADDFGSGNTLLTQLNTTSRFSGELLLDLSFEKNASFVAVFEFSQNVHPITRNTSHILLNYPTALVSSENATVLAYSSEMSWLDVVENGKHDDSEQKGPFSLLSVEPYGLGELVLFSGPSALINSMKDKFGNSVFRDNLFEYLFDGRSTVLIDESHRDVSAVLNLGYVFPISIGVEIKIIILIIVCVLFLIGFTTVPYQVVKKFFELLNKTSKSSGEESEHVVDAVLAKHAGWNRKKLERIFRELK